jgi:hypothetical protein
MFTNILEELAVSIIRLGETLMMNVVLLLNVGAHVLQYAASPPRKHKSS